jgi:ABC-type Fe3+/spermidine/putrescine transport system ATPase subunit
MFGIALDGVTKRYGESIAVEDVSLAIRPAEFLTLLGPSGCGKTTTLRMVAGLITPDRGRVHIAGKDVTYLGPAERNIGMVFQSLALFPHMTAGENVGFGLRMRRISRREAVERIKRCLAVVRLEHLQDRYPHQMSGGQQQRVALARALVIEPSILVLDEPFGALDRKLREAMQQELREITRNLRTTSLFVTHDQEEAMMLSDWVAVMNKGRVEQFGRPDEIFRQPRTKFVADFMGATNFLRAEVLDATAGRMRLMVSGVVFEVNHDGRLKSGDDIEIIVKPEWINLSQSQVEDAASIQGEIVQAIFHGATCNFVLKISDSESLVVRRGNEAGEASIPAWLSVGAKVWATWVPDAMHPVIP